jgi:SulP family sulfate permease
MVAEALAGLPPGADYLMSALALAFLSGAVLLVLGVARLGALANLIGHPVLSGFVSAAAIVIVASQLPSLLGVTAPGAGEAAQASGWSQAFRELNAATLALGLFSIAVLLASGRPLERALGALGAPDIARAVARTAPLAVLAVTTLVVGTMGLDRSHAVAVVGTLPRGLPPLGFNCPGWSALAALLPSAVLIALIGYIESVSMAKTLANRRRQTIDPNQELLALGASNLASAVSGGMPVAGSFSRTLVNFEAGARTQGAALLTAALVGAVAWFFTPLFAHVPKAALAAIIIVAVVKLIDVKAAVSAWYYDRSDGLVLLATAAVVLAIGIEVGLTAGVVLSLLLYIRRASRPHLAVLGRVPGTEHFRNVERYPDARTEPDLLLLRVDEHLSFANVVYLEQMLMEQVARAPRLRHLVLVCSGINGIDFSALEMLIKVTGSLREAGVTLHMAEVKGPVMDRLKRTELLERMAPGRVFLSTHQAVQALAGAGGKAE